MAPVVLAGDADVDRFLAAERAPADGKLDVRLAGVTRLPVELLEVENLTGLAFDASPRLTLLPNDWSAAATLTELALDGLTGLLVLPARLPPRLRALSLAKTAVDSLSTTALQTLARLEILQLPIDVPLPRELLACDSLRVVRGGHAPEDVFRRLGSVNEMLRADEGLRTAYLLAFLDATAPPPPPLAEQVRLPDGIPVEAIVAHLDLISRTRLRAVSRAWRDAVDRVNARLPASAVHPARARALRRRIAVRMFATRDVIDFADGPCLRCRTPRRGVNTDGLLICQDCGDLDAFAIEIGPEDAESDDPVVYSSDTCAHIGCLGSRTFRCGRCRTAFYCSVECQRAAWKEGHKKVCGTNTTT